MAISVTNNTTDFSAVGATSYNTKSVTPTSSSLILLAVTSRTGITVDPNQPTASGNGLTYVAINSVVFDNTSSSRRRLTLFRAMGTASAGAITLDFGGQAQTSFDIVLDEATGMDTTGTNGSGAIVQSVTNFDGAGTATTLTGTLAAFSDANNSTYGAFGFGNAAGTATVGSGFTLLGNITDGGLNAGDNRATTEWKVANDTTVDLSWSAGGEAGVIAVELKIAAAVGGTQAQTSRITLMGVGQ